MDNRGSGVVFIEEDGKRRIKGDLIKVQKKMIREF